MILHVVHYTSNNRLDSSKSKTVSKNIFDKLTYFLQLSVLLKKIKDNRYQLFTINQHILSLFCSTLFTFRTIHNFWNDTGILKIIGPVLSGSCRVCVCRSCPRYHRTETTWAQTPTTLAPARHWQYHPVAVHEECSIHRRYCLPEI